MGPRRSGREVPEAAQAMSEDIESWRSSLADLFKLGANAGWTEIGVTTVAVALFGIMLMYLIFD